jgi:hypothetical protein
MLGLLLEILAAAAGLALRLLQVTANFGDMGANLVFDSAQSFAMGGEKLMDLLPPLAQRASEIITPGFGGVRLQRAFFHVSQRRGPAAGRRRGTHTAELAV